MRIFLIIDETPFYQPDFVAELISDTKDEIVGAALVTKVLPKNNIEKYMIRNFHYLTSLELIKFGLKKTYFVMKNYFSKFMRINSFYSVKNVYEYFGIEYFNVEYNINKEKYINKIKAKSPDIIISSNSLIFGEKLLSIPKYCINRHSALLPSYGGLWPVFQAVRRNEKIVGVSVHTMDKKIDEGILLAQKEIAINKGDTVDILYQKCFGISASVVMDALNKIKNEKNLIALSNKYEPSYYSFPKKNHWKDFRKRNMAFI